MSDEVLFDLSGENSSKATILCIDDDPNVTDALARRFHPFGIEVLRAFHGMQGLWMAAQERPNAILTDLQMPRGRGDDLIRCLKANPLTANIPVFVITGIQDAGTASHLVSIGAKEVFFKPVEFNVVMEKVCEALGLALPH